MLADSLSGCLDSQNSTLWITGRLPFDLNLHLPSPP